MWMTAKNGFDISKNTTLNPLEHPGRVQPCIWGGGSVFRSYMEDRDMVQK